MPSITAIKGTVVALALGLFGNTARAATGSAAPTPPSVEITEQELDASNAKVEAAYNALIQMWSADFKKIGERFTAPRIARYRSPIRTPCGVMMPDNAGYCMADNTVYFDDIFVAAEEKIAAQALGTDGDMAGLGIIAHEMGHAVAMQLGHVSRVSYQNEATADCLAGAFAQYAQQQGQLEQGDVDEAVFGMASAGDPTPQLTGNQRTDQRILARMEMVGHGTREQRVQNFRTGLKGGAGACLDDFSGIAS